MKGRLKLFILVFAMFAGMLAVIKGIPMNWEAVKSALLFCGTPAIAAVILLGETWMSKLEKISDAIYEDREE